jgi:hypothetical protein
VAHTAHLGLGAACVDVIGSANSSAPGAASARPRATWAFRERRFTVICTNRRADRPPIRIAPGVGPLRQWVWVKRLTIAVMAFIWGLDLVA